jgi:radical SAM-linked protein
LRYRKDDVLQFVGHRDLLQFVFRVLRRARVPFATSKGYSPKPRVIFGPALPLGVTAENELLDIQLKDDASRVSERVGEMEEQVRQAAVPRDFVVELSELGSMSEPISQQVAAARYHLTVEEDARRVVDVLKTCELPYRGRRDEVRDMRTGILKVVPSAAGVVLDGGIEGVRSVNIVRLAQCLEGRYGVVCGPAHRVGLLDAKGELL